MKNFFSVLSLLALCLALAGCPQKKVEGEGATEAVEGSSTSDKSGDGASDEMQEKKPNSEAAPAADTAGEEKK